MEGKYDLFNSIDYLFYYLYRVSRPSFVTVKKEESRYNAEHVLELKNNGPSILPNAYLTIRYPQVQSGGQAHVFLNKTTVSTKYILSFFIKFVEFTLKY